MEQVTIRIEGMSCGHCVRAVERIEGAIQEEGYPARAAGR